MRMGICRIVRMATGNSTTRKGRVDNRRLGISVDRAAVVVVMAIVPRGLDKCSTSILRKFR